MSVKVGKRRNGIGITIVTALIALIFFLLCIILIFCLFL